MPIKPIILYRGARYIVELAQQTNGRSKAKDFLEELKTKHKRRWAKITTFIQRYADTGKIINNQQFKKLRGKTRLSEFKDFSVRLMMYHYGPGLIVLTHGFFKDGDSTPQSEIDRGERIAIEYDSLRRS